LEDNGSEDIPFRHGPKHPLEWAIAVMLLFTLIATGAAAYYTRNQWLTADDQEKRSLRAYLIVTSARFAKDDSGKLKFGVTGPDGRHELLIY
jgi:hypothetical protein